MKNNIIIISPFQLRIRRGVESFTYYLSNSLAKNYNMQIIIYTWESNSPIDWGDWNKNIKIRKVPYFRYYQSLIAKIFYWFWNKIDRPDKIICNFLWHGETAVYKNNHDLLIMHNPISQIPSRYEFVKNFINYNSLIMFDSFHSLEAFIAVDEKYTNCKMIHTGVDTEYFKTSLNKEKNEKLKLICISEFEERKGIQYLIKALPNLIEKFPSLFLTIIGAGKLKNHYKELISELSIDDYIDIQTPVNDTKPYLLKSDIYFLLSDGEGFPLGLLEAMSCGIPPIVSDNPPFDEIVIEGVGARVDREDPESILQAVIKLKERKVREHFGRNARTHVMEKHSWVNISKQYYDLIINK